MRAFAALLLAAVWACSQAAPALAAPRNVLLAKDRTEPVIAVDPAQPTTIVAGSNTNYDHPVGGRLPVGVYSSQNAGQSFAGGIIRTKYPYTIGADPTVAFSSSGTAFYTYLGESPAYCGGAAGAGAVMLSRSTDGARSFGASIVVDADSADDKPNMTVESLPGERAHVFVTWTRWLRGHSEIWLARSVNGGDSFDQPQLIVSTTNDNFGSVPIVGPRGHVYVFWSSFPEATLTVPAPSRILLRASSDDGVRFGAARTAAGTFQGIPRMAQPGLLRNLTMPTAAVSHAGTLFLAYPSVTARRSNGAVAADIKFTMSRDHGASWTHAIAVNDSQSGDRFMPAMSVMKDGSVGVAFYDRRNSLWSLDTYAARVEVFGRVPRASRNIRVNRVSSPVADIYYIKPGSTCFSPGRFFGDYIGVAADAHNHLCVVWADNQLRVRARTDLWFARVGLSYPATGRRQKRVTMTNAFRDRLIGFLAFVIGSENRSHRPVLAVQTFGSSSGARTP